ncbi:MAG: bifunctional phosphopantothenoylcysteine decarboxylase/phosphopantothenate--cysteine ligase CoaBC [Lewinellaceae bacterium]|nr:bifunctional phosphopantothenoylcysteine decarboxylase/phosphopantothenate--cysteine ligase CoaBC [Phaeodactylibacter sp.]MCB9036993.1 bifunctional phosphopantothenoylcysteine decarboxylase/phosphopantothenate--cysteine ligase CoaBC [Lewinellaceae bacterium]
MANLTGKKILLGVTGSIAAYKAAFLVRQFIRAGAEVQVLMTKSGADFISPLTLSTLSKRPVYTDISSEASWNSHVEMGLWADVMVVAPLTAASLAKMAAGMSDNIITATYLSARCPVFFAPAMDLDMWRHPATQENVRRLQEFGNHLIPVGHGELASGLVGEGRMAEPEEIVAFLHHFWQNELGLAGKKILITAGPTYEAIDPVRFIGNRSSGKMGVALADAAARRGAEVTLVLGPSRLAPRESKVQVIPVQTAEEMLQAAEQAFQQADIGILAAAVADYRPREAAVQKIKKTGDTLRLELVKNPDIAAILGGKKEPAQLLVGFALETENELDNAQSKLAKKNFDLIVLNSLQDKGAGFNYDTNKIAIIGKGNKIRKFELKPKTAVAEDILDEVEKLLKGKIYPAEGRG